MQLLYINSLILLVKNKIKRKQFLAMLIRCFPAFYFTLFLISKVSSIYFKSTTMGWDYVPTFPQLLVSFFFFLFWSVKLFHFINQRSKSAYTRSIPKSEEWFSTKNIQSFKQSETTWAHQI